MSFATFARAVAQTAESWRDPEHPGRADAVAATLEADNRWTEEALAFAINQKMAALTVEGLEAWISAGSVPRPQTVGLLAPGLVPLDALDDLLAAFLLGHRVICAPADSSPVLLPAFLEAVAERVPNLPVHFDAPGAVLTDAEAIVATEPLSREVSLGTIRTQCDLKGIPPSARLLRGPCYSVAVLDGRENVEDREGLAEDALLYEGHGPRSVHLLWAPLDLDPDPYFEAFAHFRSVFPAHRSTAGALQMQRAFLEAADAPHAYGEGLEFLVSRGAPDPQPPGHLRWVEYETLAEMSDWITGEADRLQYVVARPEVTYQIVASVRTVRPGEAHRHPPGDPLCGTDVVAFLMDL